MSLFIPVVADIIFSDDKCCMTHWHKKRQNRSIFLNFGSHYTQSIIIKRRESEIWRFWLAGEFMKINKCEIDSLFTVSESSSLFFLNVGHPVGCYHGNLAWLDELAFVRGDGNKYMLGCLTRASFMSCIRHGCVFLEKESCSALLLCQWSVRRPQCFLADAQTIYI